MDFERELREAVGRELAFAHMRLDFAILNLRTLADLHTTRDQALWDAHYDFWENAIREEASSWI